MKRRSLLAFRTKPGLMTSTLRNARGGCLLQQLPSLNAEADLGFARPRRSRAGLRRLLCEPLVEGGRRDAGALAGQEHVTGHLRAEQR